MRAVSRRLLDQRQLGLVVAVDVGQVVQRGFQAQLAFAPGQRGDEGAAAALRRNQAFARQQVDRLAHGDARHAELGDQRLERGQGLALFPDAARDALPQQLGELRVARNGAVAKQCVHGWFTGLC